LFFFFFFVGPVFLGVFVAAQKPKNFFWGGGGVLENRRHYEFKIYPRYKGAVEDIIPYSNLSD
jgi:hypothetical protein